MPEKLSNSWSVKTETELINSRYEAAAVTVGSIAGDLKVYASAHGLDGAVLTIPLK